MRARELGRLVEIIGEHYGWVKPVTGFFGPISRVYRRTAGNLHTDVEANEWQKDEKGSGQKIADSNQGSPENGRNQDAELLFLDVYARINSQSP